MHKPTDAACPVDAARRHYARVMSQWMLDLLELRRTGGHIPGARASSDEPASPSLRLGGAPGPAWADRNLEHHLLTWRPSRRAA